MPGRRDRGAVAVGDAFELGRRIHVVGGAGAGKSTLAQRLATLLDVPFVELDALNWEAGWYGLHRNDPEELERRIREATSGDGWVVAGSYIRFAEAAFWDRVQTVIWLDMPMQLLLRRVVNRSWRRWRTRELLWGKNYESFWTQLAIWRPSRSLIGWVLTQTHWKRREMVATIADHRWARIRFLRLRSPAEVREFERMVTDAVACSATHGSGGG